MWHVFSINNIVTTLIAEFIFKNRIFKIARDILFLKELFLQIYVVIFKGLGWISVKSVNFSVQRHD